VAIVPPLRLLLVLPDTGQDRLLRVRREVDPEVVGRAEVQLMVQLAKKTQGLAAEQAAVLLQTPLKRV